MRHALVAVLALAVAPPARGQEIPLPLPFPGTPSSTKPPAQPQGHLLPRPTAEGQAALDQLLQRAVEAGGLQVQPPGSGTYVVADAAKLKSCLGQNPKLLTAALRDALIARWADVDRVPAKPAPKGGAGPFGLGGLGMNIGGLVAPPPRVQPPSPVNARLAQVLLQAIGEATGDDRSLAFAAFLAGRAEQKQGHLAAAARQFAQAGRLFAAVKDPAWHAVALNNGGAVLAGQGDYVEAADRLQQALTLAARTHGGTHPAVATALENLGVVCKRQEDYRQAVKHFEQALAIHRKAAGDDSLLVAASLSALGELHAALPGDAAKARECFRAAEALWSKNADKYPIDATTMLDLGLNSNPHADLARDLERHKVLTSLYHVHGSNAAAIAAALDGMAAVDARQGKDGPALDNYERALKVRRNALGDSHPDVALSWWNIGLLLQKQKRYAEAAERLTDAVRALRRQAGPVAADLQGLNPPDLQPLPLTVRVLADWAHNRELSEGDRPTLGGARARARAYDLAIGALERVRAEALRSEASKVLQGAALFDVFARRVGVCLDLFTLTGQAEDLWPALTVAERGIARVFAEQLAAAHAEQFGGVSEDLRRREDELLQQLRRLGAGIDQERARPLAKRDIKALQRLLDERDRCRNDLEGLVGAMERAFPRYANLKYPRPCAPAEARACLAANEVALLYLLGTDASYVVALEGAAPPGDPTGGLSVHRLPGAAALVARVKAVMSEETLKTAEGAAAEGAKAYAALLAPVAARLRGKDLVIVPEGELCTLPFEVLVESAAQADREQYLIEGHRIRYAPSLTVLRLIRQWEASRPRPPHVLWALGDPVYEPDDARLTRAAVPAPPAAPLAPASRKALAASQAPALRAGGSWREHFGRLEHSGEELRAIRTILGAAVDDVRTGPQASEAAVKAASRRGQLALARYVHFATHGTLGLGAGQQPSLVLSLVSPDNDGTWKDGGVNDGFLRMDEVTHLKLNADLVVLSACQTGRGLLHHGEGVRGLARAFLYAGSRGVVCSLRVVDDEETARLMARFYTHLAKESAAGALRAAKLEMIKEGQAPLYWAPFILVGS